MTARFLSTPLSTRAMDVHSGSKVYTLTVSETCLVREGSSMGPMAINFCLCCSDLVKFNITIGEVSMSKVATNTNLKLPLPLLKPAPPGWWRQVKNFKL